MRLTQRERVLHYIQENGYFIPAIQRDATYQGRYLGKDADRRCREMGNEGILVNENKNKHEYAKWVLVDKNYLKPKTVVWNYTDDGRAFQTDIDEATEILKEIINQPEQEQLL